jgi:hypothetical protein
MRRGAVDCLDCGHTFPVDPVLTVTCPACHVRPGQNCRRPSGHPIMSHTRFHDTRDLAADDAGAYDHKCTLEARARVQGARAARRRMAKEA